MRALSRKLSVGLFTVVVPVFVLALVSPVSAQNGPTEQEIGLLFVHTAPRGTLMPGKGEGRFTLTLHDVNRQVVWFSDRPARQSGQIPVRGFVRTWDAFGFDEDPPNAALTLLGENSQRDTVVVELGEPRYLRKTDGLRYPAQIVGEAAGNLAHFEPHRDESIPRRFRHASLFIDDGFADLAGNCVLQAWGDCTLANLNGSNLSWRDLPHLMLTLGTAVNTNFTGADLTSSDLGGADLTGANLAGARLVNAAISGSVLERATLDNADLTYAHLGESRFTWASLVGAILIDADLGFAHLDSVNLTLATLKGANLDHATIRNSSLDGAVFTGAFLNAADFSGSVGDANFQGALFCDTVMPDGSLRRDDC